MIPCQAGSLAVTGRGAGSCRDGSPVIMYHGWQVCTPAAVTLRSRTLPVTGGTERHRDHGTQAGSRSRLLIDGRPACPVTLPRPVPPAGCWPWHGHCPPSLLSHGTARSLGDRDRGRPPAAAWGPRPGYAARLKFKFKYSEQGYRACRWARPPARASGWHGRLAAQARGPPATVTGITVTRTPRLGVGPSHAGSPSRSESDGRRASHLGRSIQS
jgi:hypothetical protein